MNVERVHLPSAYGLRYHDIKVLPPVNVFVRSAGHYRRGVGAAPYRRPSRHIPVSLRAIIICAQQQDERLIAHTAGLGGNGCWVRGRRRRVW